METLKQGAGLFEKRNEVVHGRLYGSVDSATTELRRGRPGGATREVTADELYELAKKFDDYCGELMRAQVIKLPRAICKYLKQP